MSKKLTAVEYLENQLKKSKYFYKLIEDLGYQSSVIATDVFTQSKEIEKQQIIDACDVGFDDGCGFTEDMKYKDGEQYYNETYELS